MLSFTRTSSAIKQYLKIVEAATVVCILGDTQQDTVAGPSKRAPDSASALHTSEDARLDIAQRGQRKSARLGDARVRITGTERAGTIQVVYANAEELERLAELMGARSR